MLIERKCQYGTNWSVNNTSFPQYYIEACKKAILYKNIFSAWIATSLIIYDPELVIIKKSLKTGSIKSLSFILLFPSNSMHYIFFLYKFSYLLSQQFHFSKIYVIIKQNQLFPNLHIFRILKKSIQLYNVLRIKPLVKIYVLRS